VASRLHDAFIAKLTEHNYEEGHPEVVAAQAALDEAKETRDALEPQNQARKWIKASPYGPEET